LRQISLHPRDRHGASRERHAASSIIVAVFFQAIEGRANARLGSSKRSDFNTPTTQ
jgi:hypothetical protein